MRLKRHHWIFLTAATLLVTGWLLWNVLTVGSDLSAPPGTSPPAAQRQ